MVYDVNVACILKRAFTEVTLDTLWCEINLQKINILMLISESACMTRQETILKAATNGHHMMCNYFPTTYTTQFTQVWGEHNSWIC